MTAPTSVKSDDVKGNTLDTSVEKPLGDSEALAPAFANQADTEAQLKHAAVVKDAVAASRSEKPEATDDEKANMIERSKEHTFINSTAAADDVDEHIARQREADMKKIALDSGVPMGSLAAVKGVDADTSVDNRLSDDAKKANVEKMKPTDK